MLLDDVRRSVRITHSNMLDEDLMVYIQTALYDIERAGIKVENPDDPLPVIKNAVICFVKANFGNADMAQKAEFQTRYNYFLNRMVTDGNLRK